MSSSDKELTWGGCLIGTGVGIFGSWTSSSLGGLILGAPVGLPCVVGGAVLGLPLILLLDYLNNLEKSNSISKRELNFYQTLALATYGISSAAIGSLILGQAILPALMVSSVGVAVFIAASLICKCCFDNLESSEPKYS